MRRATGRPLLKVGARSMDNVRESRARSGVMQRWRYSSLAERCRQIVPVVFVFGPFRVNHRERDPRSSVVGALVPTHPNKPKKEKSRPLWFLIEQGGLVTVDD